MPTRRHSFTDGFNLFEVLHFTLLHVIGSLRVVEKLHYGGFASHGDTTSTFVAHLKEAAGKAGSRDQCRGQERLAWDGQPSLDTVLYSPV